MSALDVDKDELLCMVAMHASTIVSVIQASGGNGDAALLRRFAEAIEHHSARLGLLGPLLAADMGVAADAYEKKQREMAQATEEAQGATKQ